MGWFEAEADWLGSPIRPGLRPGRGPGGVPRSMRPTALMKPVRRTGTSGCASCAARDLLDLANDWASGRREEEDEDERAQRSPRSSSWSAWSWSPVQLLPQGRVPLSSGSTTGTLFWGHSIHVTGSLESGPESAQMEG
ncbi:MAG: DUF2262 domain-containing protein [Lawsonibacter sp.]